MQTFLPYPSFTDSAVALDNKRLGKQRVEVLQILNALAGKSKGWVNHPASKMWQGHENALIEYGLQVCSVWKSYGFKDTCFEKIAAFLDIFPDEAVIPPTWVGNPDFHAAHRAKLLQKDFEYYSNEFKQDEIPENWQTMEYIWPNP